MPSLTRKLADIRDLLRTGTPPESWGMTMEDWERHKNDRSAGLLTSIIDELEAKEAHRRLSSEEKLKLRLAKKKLELRDKHRSTTCLGCPDNRYNFQSDGDGWDAPTTGEGCYHLGNITRGVCKLKHYKTGGRY